MKKRYIGVLLNRSWYRGMHSGRTGHEVLLQYVLMGKRFGVTPCFIQLGDMKPGAQKVKAYVHSNWRYVRTLVPMPSVVHNRAIYKSKQANDKIRRIVEGGTTIFNRYNRYGKRKIHKLLMINEEIRSHLPETIPATADSVLDMMKRYPSLIIKPNNGSIGKGIMLLERRDAESETDTVWRLRYRTRANRKAVKEWPKTEPLPAILLSRMNNRRYLVQQRLPLAKFKDSPFDIRVSVQRDRTGEWQVTGMVGKAAAKQSFLTNVAQGGQIYPLDLILKSFPELNPETVKNDLIRLGIQVAEHLSEYLPDLADIGLDIGITEHGFPMFIECNGRDLRYSFLRGGLLKEWANTYGNPMGYGAYLLDRGVQDATARANVQ